MSLVALINYVVNRQGVLFMMAGAAAQRPAPVDGLMYIDTETPAIYFSVNGAWIDITGGGAAASLEEVTQVGNTTEQGIEFLGNLTFPSENIMMRLYLDGAIGRIKCWDYRPTENRAIPFLVESSELYLQGTDNMSVQCFNGGGIDFLPVPGGTGIGLVFELFDTMTAQFNGVANYQYDMSAMYTSQSLVDKQYVDAQVLVNNGLTKLTGQPAQLGGSLVKNTVIDYAGFALQIMSTALPVGAGYLQIASTGVAIGRTDAIGQLIQGFDVGALFGSNTVVYGFMNYAADYSASFTARSIVDKAYADAAAAAAVTPLAGTNGITRTGNNFLLGGTLNANTVINTSTFTYTLGRISTANGCQIIMDASNLRLRFGRFSNTNTDVQTIAFDNTTNNMVVTDTLSRGGLRNAADYSAFFVNESLATVRYVNNAIAFGSYTLTGDGVTSTFVIPHTAGFTPREVLIRPQGVPVTFLSGAVPLTIMPYIGITAFSSTTITIGLSAAIIAAFGTTSQNLSLTFFR